MRKLVWLAAAAVGDAGAAARAGAGTPRKGGTIRMTSPYAASFGSLDLHTTPRAQDEIVGKALNRTLYNWDSANNKLVLELATSVTASADGLIHTYKLRDDAYFHNGRKMTADDIIWSFTRIMDGSKGYPGARYVRIDQGRGRGREGPGQGDRRPEEDRRLHARDDAHRPRRSRLLLLRRHDRDPAQGRGREGQLRLQSGRASGRSSSRSTSRARASSPSASTSSTSRASPMPTASWW